MKMNEAKRIVRRAAPAVGLMKISEAALIAGLNPETLRRRVRRGDLAAWGSPRRVALADVMAQFVPHCMQEIVDGSGNRKDGNS